MNMKRGWEYGWEMDEMNMTRTMGCKIWITCQDQRYERIIGLCGIVNVEGIWKVHMDG